MLHDRHRGEHLSSVPFRDVPQCLSDTRQTRRQTLLRRARSSCALMFAQSYDVLLLTINTTLVLHLPGEYPSALGPLIHSAYKLLPRGAR